MLSKKIALISVGAAIASVSAIANAGLYVYPVSSHEVQPESKVNHLTNNESYHSTSPVDYTRRAAPSPHPFYREDVSINNTADMTVNNQRSIANNLPCYGKDVPIEIAAKEVLAGSYRFNIQDDIRGKRVSWAGNGSCQQIEDIVSNINSQNDIHIHLAEGYAGIAEDAFHAKYYADETPNVWKSDPGLTISENMTEWAESKGWSVVWPAIIEEYDFESADTTLYGPLIGKDGVFHNVLKQIEAQNHDISLSVVFYANKHIVVTEGGFEKDNGKG